MPKIRLWCCPSRLGVWVASCISSLIESSSFLCTLSNLPKLELGGTLQLSDSDYTFLGRLMFLKQNILSAIKVMKSRAGGRVGQMLLQKKLFFEVYVIVWIRKNVTPTVVSSKACSCDIATPDASL